ncbi:MAG: hypothetical protein WCF18_12790 [Chthoniobacteraceae bacterium]
MKHLLFAAVLLPLALLAQAPQLGMPVRPQLPGAGRAPADTLADNYQLTLTLTDKDGPPLEVAVVVASSQFTASLDSLGIHNLAFTGTVTVEESGSIVIAYGLGWQTPSTTDNGNIQFHQSNTQGSVRLKLGEEVQIIRAGSRTARLAITKLEPPKSK